jgi:hypothetical protein
MATCVPQTALRSGARRGTALVASAVLVLVLALGLPLFVCMPLWNDVNHYDLCARTLLRGGALYRDAFDNNLPGVVWAQAAVRAALGWRPEALRRSSPPSCSSPRHPGSGARCRCGRRSS